METATSLVIIQLADYLRGLTQRLDPGAGWYGEFLRRDPDGVRACLDGRAMAPWDVVESLLADLAVARGAEFAGRETAYAARLRAAAVTAWDRLPGGEAELRTLLAASAAQRADSEAALRHLTARLSATSDPAQAEALSRELAWTRDDATRATSRQADLTSRLAAVSPAGEAAQAPAAPAAPGPAVPGGPAGTGSVPGPDRPRPPEAGPARTGSADGAPRPGPAAPVNPVPAGAGARSPGDEPLEGVPRQRVPEDGERPVGRAEGRWLRGGRRSGGARYAGSAAPEPPVFTPPPGADETAPNPAPRGARFGSPREQAPADAGHREPPPPGRRTEPPAGTPTGWGGPAPDVFPGDPTGVRPVPGGPVTGGPAGRGAPVAAGFPGDPAGVVVGVAAGQAGPVPGGFPGGPGAGAGPGSPVVGRYPESAAGGPAGRGEPVVGGFPGDPARVVAGVAAGHGGPVPGGFPGGPGAGAGPGSPVVGRYPESAAGGPAGRGGPVVGGFAGASAGAPAGLGEPVAGGVPGGNAGVGAGGSVPGVVEALLALRAQHRSGEAHALLCEAAAWPAGRLPALAAELHRAGLAADWATLLWEAASLPPERLAAAAAALGEAGREADCDLLLRQGAARPAAEIADAALALGGAGRDREAQALLGAYVRLHTAEESAALARQDPQWFAPRLLRAARALSGAHHRDLSHALRVSGVALA